MGPREQPAVGRPRVWARQVEEFLAWKRAESDVGSEWLRRMGWELHRVPKLLVRAGVTDQHRRSARLSITDVNALRAGLRWQRSTFLVHFAALRQFLRWSGSPLADRSILWRLPAGQTSHRRWLTKQHLHRLYAGSTGRARILVGLEGLNGLRRVEVLRLRVRDVSLENDTLAVRGKGGRGGKWRTIPIHPAVRRDLVAWIKGQELDDPILPLSRSGADLLLRRAALTSGLGPGLRVSHHDLRRTFGRLAHEAGMDLVQLKNLLGHASVEMTVHYIGLDTARMREGLGRFARFVRLGSYPGGSA